MARGRLFVVMMQKSSLVMSQSLSSYGLVSALLFSGRNDMRVSLVVARNPNHGSHEPVFSF